MADIKAKAWTYTSIKNLVFEDLQLTDHTIPDTKEDHVLIEVLNASLNPGDIKFPNIPILGRFITKPASPAFDFCGRIRALPPNFTNTDSRNLHVGQIVFGMHRDLKSLGVLKTLLWVHKDAMFPLPSTIPTEHGSAIGVGALTAYQTITTHMKPNGRVLVNGGTGGVGTFCIQIAKALGQYVIATCSSAGRQLCLDLGADETIDYKSPTFRRDLCRTHVDLVVDNVGNDPAFHRRSAEFLNPDGHFVLVSLMDGTWTGIGSMLSSWLLPTWLGGPARKWSFVFTESAVGDLEALARFLEGGKVKVVVDTVFPFGEVPAAYKKLKSGRAKGKVIVDIVGYTTSQ